LRARSASAAERIRRAVVNPSMRVIHYCVLTAVLVVAAASAGAAEEWTSKTGLYRVSYRSELTPIEINTIHSWVVHVTTADGRPVDDAKIEFGGGMPAHNHGLPTQPNVTQRLGHGDYRVEGIRFHMAGDWQITLTIDASAGRDTCTIPLKL
jgi:YtkA-like